MEAVRDGDASRGRTARPHAEEAWARIASVALAVALPCLASGCRPAQRAAPPAKPATDRPPAGQGALARGEPAPAPETKPPTPPAGQGAPLRGGPAPVEHAAEEISLVSEEEPLGGWTFGNGPEFPGARGELTVDGEVADAFRPALRLYGDFTGGGNYVQAAVKLPGKNVDTISFLVRTPGAERITVRLVDGTDQCHQIRVRLRGTDDWQELRFPVSEFFSRMGDGSSLDVVASYEKWGGANDSRWHDPGKLLAILIGREQVGPSNRGAISIGRPTLVPESGSTASVRKTVRLDEFLAAGGRSSAPSQTALTAGGRSSAPSQTALSAGEVDWRFSLGEEFPGAKGELAVLEGQPEKGANALQLKGDFSGGGAYVAAIKSLDGLGAESLDAIRLGMRSANARSYTLQLVDGSGQCHQRKGMPIEADGEWHEVVLDPREIAGGEHWGGANDGKWHDPGRSVAILLTKGSNPDGAAADLAIADIRAEIVAKARVKPPAYREGFERSATLPGQWRVTGNASVSAAGAFKGERSLRLERTLERLRDETRAVGADFPAAAGTWQVEGACSADLHSPDNSYNGAITVEALGAGDAVLERIPVENASGKADWRAFSKQVDLPAGTERARFSVELQKTYGALLVDELTAAQVVSAEKRVERIVIWTDRIGNLLLPGDRPLAHVSVETPKPLPPNERAVRYSVRDYWGAERAEPATATLEARGRSDGRFVYTGDLDLSGFPMDVGAYYEIHVEALCAGAPAREYSGLAFLPVAAAKGHRPEDVPFTIRNWDSRITEYFLLADRLGLRQMGVWGGWDANPPCKPDLPNLETCRKVGAKWVTGTPGASIERDGFAQYSEEALRSGMRNFLQEYADDGLLMICLGNEPHGKREKVRENVRAYKALYEAAKAFDPGVVVVGTSVEPNRDYFEEGYHRCLDIYDFHIYESYTDVRRTIREYRALMKEFDAEKPIISTELGLNSQGQTRIVVACELVKKVVSLFAEGGSSVSWFTIQYPDPQGKARGTFGDAHCVFDCKYNRFNPRLDAIAYYNMVNGVCAKKFVEERQHPNGVQAYLFRDGEGRCLQILWREGGRLDVLVPLPGVKSAELVRIDGGRTKFDMIEGGVTLGVSPEPVLLFYDQARGGLAESLGEPRMALASGPGAVRAGGACAFTVRGPGLAAGSVRVVAPPRWSASLEQKGAGAVECRVTAPRQTAAEEGRLLVQLLAPTGAVAGETTVPVPVAKAAR